MLLAQDCLLGGGGGGGHCTVAPTGKFPRSWPHTLTVPAPSFSGLPSLCSSSENLV